MSNDMHDKMISEAGEPFAPCDLMHEALNRALELTEKAMEPKPPKRAPLFVERACPLCSGESVIHYQDGHEEVCSYCRGKGHIVVEKNGDA